MDISVYSARSSVDEDLLNDPSTLYFTRLQEPGWIDPDVVNNHLPTGSACLAANSLPTLTSIYVSGRKHRSLSHIKYRQEVFPLPGKDNVTRQLLVRFSDAVSVREYHVCPEMSASVWRSTSGTSRYARKRFDTEDSPVHSGGPTSLYDDVLEYDKAKCRTGGSSLRSAIARALSLATLLGLPARTTCAYSRHVGGHMLIADTGCGKDMVSNSTFSDAYLADHSWKRTNPMRIQTANGIVELDTEVKYRIDKLKETTSAIIGGNTPDLLSIGYRCQELGFGFHWEPHSIPYFILPDKKTEIDLEVENYVPYLYNSGSISAHLSCVNIDTAGYEPTCCHIDDLENEWKTMFDISDGLLGELVCDAGDDDLLGLRSELEGPQSASSEDRVNAYNLDLHENISIAKSVPQSGDSSGEQQGPNNAGNPRSGDFSPGDMSQGSSPDTHIMGVSEGVFDCILPHRLPTHVPGAPVCCDDTCDAYPILEQHWSLRNLQYETDPWSAPMFCYCCGAHEDNPLEWWLNVPAGEESAHTDGPDVAKHKRDLRAEAVSLWHLLKHPPKNPIVTFAA